MPKLENMEDKILNFQNEHVSVKTTHSRLLFDDTNLTHPSYNNGSNQDEPKKQPPEVFCKKALLEILLNSL